MNLLAFTFGHVMLAVLVVIVGAVWACDVWRRHVRVDTIAVVEIDPALAEEIARGDLAVVMHGRRTKLTEARVRNAPAPTVRVSALEVQ